MAAFQLSILADTECADLTAPEPLERAFATLAAMLDEREAIVGADGQREA